MSEFQLVRNIPRSLNILPKKRSGSGTAITHLKKRSKLAFEVSYLGNAGLILFRAWLPSLRGFDLTVPQLCPISPTAILKYLRKENSISAEWRTRLQQMNIGEQ